MARRRPRTGEVAPDAEIGRFTRDLSLIGMDRGPLALAVSGGPDSMALLLLAAAARPGQVVVATVDHRLRLAGADEAASVARECAALGVPHATLVPETPIAGSSLQARARDARYALLARWARAQGATALATAHHADDQAETFLMRAARGSGLSGLAGIRAKVEIDGMAVIRPLLDWRRAELRAIVRRAGVAFVDDPANHDPRHDRTRFRQMLELHEWLGVPQLAAAAARLAEVDGDVRATVDWLWREHAHETGAEVSLEVAGLPRELRRRLVRRAIDAVRTATGLREPSFDAASNVEPLLDALAANRRATQGGVLASVRGGRWSFRVAPRRRG